MSATAVVEQFHFVASARDLLAAVCVATGANTVFLPGLYCGEVTRAIAAAGLQWRNYEIGGELVPVPDQDAMARARGTVCLVWCHMFGLMRPPPALPAHVRLVEDCCHSLRSWFARPTPERRAGPSVFSPRKELGWAEGGFAIQSDDARTSTPAARHVRDRWEALRLSDTIANGRRRTRAARATLGGLLPRGDDRDVLTFLPLLAAGPDDPNDVVDALRFDGLDAWRWLDPPCVREPAETPQAVAIWRKLVLVRLPEDADYERQMRIIAGRRWRPWTRRITPVP